LLYAVRQNQNQPKPGELKEEILWHRILQTGIFRKKVSEALLVTDQRVVKELPQSGHLFTLLLTQIDDIQVLNQHRSSNMDMNMVGIRSGHMRTGQYYGQSRSKTIGDILFMSKDYQDFSFNNRIRP
jgi:hypothetical protein